MKFGIYYNKNDNNLNEDFKHQLNVHDLLQSLSEKNVTLCMPSWMGHQKEFRDFKNIQYLSPDEYYSLDNHFVFLDYDSLLSSWFENKNICFVQKQFGVEIRKLMLEQETLYKDLQMACLKNEVSFINHFYKKLYSPFDTLFSKPNPKYRNCFIISDPMVSRIKTMGFDPSQDFALTFTFSADQKQTYESIENGLVSPADIYSSFRQALLAENIYIEPDTFDLQVLSKILKDLSFTSAQVSTSNRDLKKIMDLKNS